MTVILYNYFTEWAESLDFNLYDDKKYEISEFIIT